MNKNQIQKVSLCDTPFFSIFQLRFFQKVSVGLILGLSCLIGTACLSEYMTRLANSNIINYLSLLLLIPCGYIVVLIWKILFKGVKKKDNIAENLRYFIKSNGLYQTESKEIYDNGNLKKQKVIVNSVILGYWQDDDNLLIRAYKTGDCYTDKVNTLDTTLSALFDLTLDNKKDTISYCDYIFKKKRAERFIISNQIVSYNNSGLLPLNALLSWNILKQPHLLLAGVTGSGKTTFLNYLIIEMKKMQADIYICDPKRSDLASLKSIFGAEYVASDVNNIAKLSRLVKEVMENRFITYKESAENFVYGYSFVDYGLKPVFIIFDELGAFRASADKKVFAETMANLTEVILKGREMGVFCVLSTQQPNANNIPTELRDNLSVRLAMGNMGGEAYRMVFGEDIKDLQAVNPVGGGYIYLDGLGWSKPKPFEAPYLDYKNFNFIEELTKYQKCAREKDL